MKKVIALVSLCTASALLSGCVAEPAPYYGSAAPYYGTTYVPAYAYGEVNVAGSYYPAHHAQHIYSNYNNNYWHHQAAVAHRGPAHGAPASGHPMGGHPSESHH